MSFFSSGGAENLISTYGYWGVALAIGIESIGIPLPGETALVAAAIYAGTTHKLNIWLVLLAASGGAAIGGVFGFLLGDYLGYWLLIHYGKYVGLNTARIKVGHYLFLHYGTKVVFFGRFFAILRELANFLAGANRMPWRPFLIANVTGAIAWAAFYGLGAYLLGKAAHVVAPPVAVGFGVLTAVVITGLIVFFRRNEARLEKLAEKELPGPLLPIHAHKKR